MGYLSMNFAELCPHRSTVVTKHLVLSVECTQAKSYFSFSRLELLLFFSAGDGSMLILLKCLCGSCEAARVCSNESFLGETMQCLHTQM